MNSHAQIQTALGEMLLATDGDALTGAWFLGQKYFPTPDDIGTPVALDESEILSQAKRELDEYFAGERTEFEVPLAPDGTDFQLAVWDAIAEIPFGYTTTYGAISKIVGPGAPAQAVGQAVGHNKLLLFIPCHRVVAADGKLTGYAGGVDKKEFLLNLEKPAPEEAGMLF